MTPEFKPLGRETVLVLQCIWCSSVYGEKPGHGVSGISHGCCPKCCAMCGRRDMPLDSTNWCPECVLDDQLIAAAQARRGTPCMA